jgi:hypothetical protein
MASKELSKSLRKYVRKEKARINREVVKDEKKKQLISDLYKKLLNKDSKKS